MTVRKRRDEDPNSTRVRIEMTLHKDTAEMLDFLADYLGSKRREAISRSKVVDEAVKYYAARVLGPKEG